MNTNDRGRKGGDTTPTRKLRPTNKVAEPRGARI